jgi:signal peptidase I
MRQLLLFFWEILKVALVALLIVIPIRTFVFQPFIVRGVSMEPTFHSGDYLIIDQISYRFREPERGEVIVFNFPRAPSQRYIKRIIGLPGEAVEIKDGKIFITDEFGKKIVLEESSYLPESFKKIPIKLKINLGKEEYFVLGDNRAFSSDSRKWGPLERKYIIGKVLIRLWPFTALAEFEKPKY